MAKGDLKELLFRFCKDYALNRISIIDARINELKISLSEETKSSAGDKHETGRAMIQIERENLGKQLAVAEKMKSGLNKINIGKKRTVVAEGSLVFTSSGKYFIAISAGEFKTSKDSIYCISSGTPISRLLIGRSVGEAVELNGRSIEILEIV